MKCLKVLITVGCAMVFNTVSYGQLKPKYKISIGQSTSNSLTRGKPATLTAVFPNDTTANSQSINGFFEFGYDFVKDERERFAITAFMERHLNTLISKKQDVFQAGGQFTTEFFHRKKFFGVYKVKAAITGKHSDDREKDKTTGQFLLHLNLVPTGQGSWFDAMINKNVVFPSSKYENYKNAPKSYRDTVPYVKDASDYIQWSGSHTVGLEHITNPRVTAFHLGYGISVYPFSGLLHRVFDHDQTMEISYGIDLWERLSEEEVDLFLGTSHTWAFGLNFFVNKEKKQAIGLKYSIHRGGNPLIGLADQNFEQIALSAVFTLKNLD